MNDLPNTIAQKYILFKNIVVEIFGNNFGEKCMGIVTFDT